MGATSVTGVGVAQSRFDPPSKEALKKRPDIKELLELEDDQFDSWYAGRRLAISTLKEQWELFISIPDLSYNGVMGHDSKTVVKEVVDGIRKAEKDLERILEIREEWKHETHFDDS